MSQEAEQICNSSPKSPHIDGPAHSRTSNDVPCPSAFPKPLVKNPSIRKILRNAGHLRKEEALKLQTTTMRTKMEATAMMMSSLEMVVYSAIT